MSQPFHRDVEQLSPAAAGERSERVEVGKIGGVEVIGFHARHTSTVVQGA